MLGFGGHNKGKRTGPVGLAVSGQEVRLAQRLAGGGFALECEALCAQVDRSGPAYHTEVSRAVSVAMRRGGFAGRRVVSALPIDALRYKTLRLPPMPDDDLAQAVAWEAGERLQLGDDHALQYYRAGEVQQGNEQREEVILLAASSQQVNEHAVALKRAGLTPIAIDASAAALARLFGGADSSNAIIHLTHDQAEIIGVRGGRVIFDKPVELSVQEGVIDAAALAREVSLCVRYLSVTFGVHRPDMTWVCGEAVDEALIAALSETLRLPISTAETALAEHRVHCEPAEAARWALAVGLAQRNEKGSARRGAA